MLVANQDIIRRWFYTSQESDPLKWVCAKRILQKIHQRGKIDVHIYISTIFFERLNIYKKKKN